jgi:hypothetical protein
MSEEEHFSGEAEKDVCEAQQEIPSELPETTTLSYERDTFVEKTYNTWCQQFHNVPCVYIRGDVDFIEPASRPGKWKKKRTVDLKEWHKVRQWEHDDTGRMLIDYTFARGPYQSQSETKEQWVRPMKLFESWPYVQIRRDFAAEWATHEAQ